MPTKHTTGNCTGCTLLSWQKICTNAATPKQKNHEAKHKIASFVAGLLNENASQLLTSTSWWFFKT